MSEAVIEFRSVSKRFRIHHHRTLREFVPALLRGEAFSEPFYALRDVSFSVAPGETVGIVGRNGSGKSTILKIIAGVTAPTAGTVTVRGRVSPLIELGAGFHPDMTGRENIFMNASILGMSNREIRERFADIVSFAELWEFIDVPVKRYSSGMYVRLGFSVAVHSDPDILLVDEVLAVGDLAFQEKCLAKMRQFQEQGVTIVLVSHSLELVNLFCHRALWLDGGRVVAEGRPAEVTQLYAESLSRSPSPT
ncbi:Teichoic acids export ATP-binding protein TagH [bacterium HR24]|nr:Teichoic acids export ATP-binding protein TagH [bacterium HR24]